MFCESLRSERRLEGSSRNTHRLIKIICLVDFLVSVLSTSLAEVPIKIDENKNGAKKTLPVIVRIFKS